MELLWMHCYSSPGKRFAFNNKSYIKNFHECWSVFSKRYTFSASEGFFGVFNPFLGITVLSKSDRVEFLNFFYIYLLHTILQILAKDTVHRGHLYSVTPSQLNLGKSVSTILNGPAAKLTNTIQFFDFVVMLLSWSD